MQSSYDKYVEALYTFLNWRSSEARKTSQPSLAPAKSFLNHLSRRYTILQIWFNTVNLSRDRSMNTRGLTRRSSARQIYCAGAVTPMGYRKSVTQQLVKQVIHHLDIHNVSTSLK